MFLLQFLPHIGSPTHKRGFCLVLNCLYHEAALSRNLDIELQFFFLVLWQVREPLPLIVHHLPVAVTFAFIGTESTVVSIS